MPELPEVETIVRTLRPRVVGQIIRRVCLYRADIVSPPGADLAALLQSQTIASVERRGKRIVFTLSGGGRFYVHLGMTGRLTLCDPAEPKPPHTHLELDLASEQLRFCDPRRFGGIWWLGQPSGIDDSKMGPEPLGLRTAALAKRLAKTTRAIKSALLDQSLIAGLGNIYVDESLFLAGIHPLMPANALSSAQVANLNRAIKSTLRRAIRHKGSTLRDYVDAEGKSGGFQNLHRVYDRAGKPCRNCKTSIERIVLGGRSTHFCPKCQRSH
jgi:formamidopyrimidine-DNA glycosylase